MQYPDRIDYRFADEVVLPRMFKARQVFKGERIDDIPGAVVNALAGLRLPPLSGKRVALTGGSRGVANQALVLRTTAEFLKVKGAKPFIVPAMGSHAGARSDTQVEFLAGYGITEAVMGVPILATMDVIEIGRTSSGFPVYCDRNAAEADYILPVHRIKPHTDFKGPLESGICKMMIIGLGKHKGASHIHQLGYKVFAETIPEAAKVFISSGRILAALGMVENAFDETKRIEAMLPSEILEKEKEMLSDAKASMAKFLVDAIDVLVVEEVGKDISGSGMDCNITGRPTSGMPGFSAPPIQNIAVLGTTPQSHGNAGGIGTGDVVTVNFMKQFDPGPAYTNAITARILSGARLPLVANNDMDAIKIALYCCIGVDPATAKVVQIANTLMMSDLLLSEAYLPLVKDDPRFEIHSAPEPMRFDDDGRVWRLPRHGNIESI